MVEKKSGFSALQGPRLPLVAKAAPPESKGWAHGLGSEPAEKGEITGSGLNQEDRGRWILYPSLLALDNSMVVNIACQFDKLLGMPVRDDLN